MSEPLKVGDLVVHVRCCCDYQRGNYLGMIFRVGFIQDIRTTCRCGTVVAGPHAGYRAETAGAPIGWLKRIPPIDELEGVKTEEDIREPV